MFRIGRVLRHSLVSPHCLLPTSLATRFPRRPASTRQRASLTRVTIGIEKETRAGQ
jgi:hypothetical protein